MIFLDAGPMIALFYRDDPFHEAARAGFERLEKADRSVFTTTHCVTEAIAVLSALPPSNFLRAARAGLEILQWPIEVVRASTEEERRALRLMESYAELGASFVDCLSFVLMDARGTQMAFTFDRDHFVTLRKLKAWVPIPKAPARAPKRRRR